MGERQASDRGSKITSSRWFRPGLIAGVVVLGIVVVCVVGLALFSMAGRSGSDADVAGSRAFQGLPPEGKSVEVVVEKEVIAEAPAAPMDESGRYQASNLAYAAERLIIRTGNIVLVVEDTRAVQETIEEMVAGMSREGAFVVSSDEYGGMEGSQPNVTMSIRVPASRFDEVMDRLAGLAVEVISRNESAQDVTEEYVDLEARLESLEAARERLLEIMQEARSTKDLL
ncbi:MAG TPA: DUF4349 domain-containing protein, partial [Anaerolineae bacterium]|nr:DUF4349 domain-containing protein [Anaerolineae bacterium]